MEEAASLVEDSSSESIEKQPLAVNQNAIRRKTAYPDYGEIKEL